MVQNQQAVIQKFRIEEVSKLIDVSIKNIKEWEKLLDELIKVPIDSFGTPFYTEKEIYTLLQFKNYTSEGLPLDIAKDLMLKNYNPPNKDSSIQIMNRTQAVQAIKDLKLIIAELNNKIDTDAQNNLTKVSDSLITEMESYLHDNLGKRDQDLMTAIRELQQAKIVVANTSESKKKWWRFWS